MVDITNIFKIGMNRTGATALSNSGSSSTASSEDESGNSANATKKFSIKVGGELHSMVMDEDGTVWDYNQDDDTWTQRDDSNVYQFQTDDIDYGKTIDLSKVKASSVIITDRSDSSSSTYNLPSGSTINKYSFNLISKNDIDNDPDNYNVAIIDNFSDTSDVEIAGTDITHGDLVRALISGKVDTDTDTQNSLNYDLGTDFSYANILNKLNQIETSVLNGKDIDAVNLSLGVAQILAIMDIADEVSLEDLGTNAGKDKMLSALEDEGQTELVSVINKITEMAEKGIEFYISSGNDADDVYAQRGTSNVIAISGEHSTLYSKGDGTYEYYEDADYNADGKITNDELYNYYYDSDEDGYITDNDTYLLYKAFDSDKDGKITGSELGVFNALTLARGNNVHVIGATSSSGIFSSSVGGVADYSDENGTVDAYYDGDVTLNNLGLKDGKYGYDIDGDGKADIFSSYDSYLSSEKGYTYLGYNADTGLHEFEDSEGYLVYSTTSDGRNQVTEGTSFSTPRAAKKNDKNLT